MSQNAKNSKATTNLQEDEPHEGPSTSRSAPIAIARKQINEVIQFQEPSTSKSYSLKTEIRIDIVEEPSQNSLDAGESTLTLFRGEGGAGAKKENLSEESFMTTDTCLKEKSTGTMETVLFSRNERTQRAVLRGHSEAPPPYTSLPPPPYSSPSPYASQLTTQSLHAAYPENDWMILSDRLRRSFSRKVLATVGLQLAISTTLVAVTMFHPGTKLFVVQELWMSVLCLVGFMASMLFLGCIQACRKMFPWNYILLLIHTLSLSYAIAMIAANFPTIAVLVTTATLCAISFVMCLLAFQKLFEVTRSSSITCLGLVIVFAFGFGTLIQQARNRVIMFDLIWSGLAVLAGSVGLLLDLQLLLRGKRIQLGPGDYVDAAAVIFTDFPLILVYLGQLMCRRRRD